MPGWKEISTIKRESIIGAQQSEKSLKNFFSQNNFKSIVPQLTIVQNIQIMQILIENEQEKSVQAVVSRLTWKMPNIVLFVLICIQSSNKI